jgi:hypothetical protein
MSDAILFAVKADADALRARVDGASALPHCHCGAGRAGQPCACGRLCYGGPADGRVNPALCGRVVTTSLAAVIERPDKLQWAYPVTAETAAKLTPAELATKTALPSTYDAKTLDSAPKAGDAGGAK